MYCLNCGSQMEEGSKFCIACGAKAENNGAKAEADGLSADIIAPVQETAAQEAAVSVEGTSALVEEPVQFAPKPEPQQPVQQVTQSAPPQPVQQATQSAPPQPVQQPVQRAQAAQSKPAQSTFTPPVPQQPVQQAQPQYNANMQQQQAIPQQGMLQTPEKMAPLPVWKFIGIFLIMGVPILGIVMVFVWAFGSSFNRNTRNYARAVLIMALIALVLTIVGYFTIWANIQDIMNNLVPNSGLPGTN